MDIKIIVMAFIDLGGNRNFTCRFYIKIMLIFQRGESNSISIILDSKNTLFGLSYNWHLMLYIIVIEYP